MKNLTEKQVYLLISALGVILFIPFLGQVHLFDWDEINFAECAREMIATGDYLRMRIDFAPFWEKPPLFVWLQVISMHIFGVGEFAARLPNALTGIATLLILYTIGKKLFNREFGLFWVLAYAGSFLPFFYFKSGIIDPLFNLMMFLSVVFIIYYYSDENRGMKYIIWGGLFAGLAILTKGPVGLLLPGITWAVYWLLFQRKKGIPWKEVIVFLLMSSVVSLMWFGVEIIKNGPWFVEEFIRYQIRLLTTGDAGHSGPFHYHFVVVLLGCFPASIFIFRSFKGYDGETENKKTFRYLMTILMLVVLIIFSIVKTKILHYSSLTYFPVTFLAALALYRIKNGETGWKWWQTALLSVIGFIYFIIFAGVPLIGLYKDSIIGSIKDKFAAGNLSLNVSWSWWDTSVGVIFLVLFVTGMILILRKQYLRGFTALFGVITISLWLFLPIVLPKLETHIQGAPVKFYEGLQGKDVYVNVMGFKSYSHYFYTRKPFELSAYALDIPNSEWQEWLLTGPIDKPAYMVTKNKEAYQWIDHPNLILLGEEGGYVFFKREVPPADTTKTIE